MVMHKWSEATDGTGNVVRTVLFDYRKAFDLVDHLILARNIIQLSVPSFVKKWILDLNFIKQTSTGKTVE